MSATPQLPTPGTVVDDKYEIEALIGQGGMAAVYRARHRFSHRTVAIKWLLPRVARDPSIVERFLREARAASSLEHPAVVAVLDVGRWNDGYYLVMEHLVGETLRQRLARGPLALEEALAVVMPLLGALASAHAKGIVHRDIKPENVFLKRHEDGHVTPKLLDFGISKLSAEQSLTLTGAVIGTPDYLAPEQITSSKDIDARTDVYQLGVLLYELLGGRMPFVRPSYEALLVAILSDEPTPLATLRPDLPPAIVRTIARAMAREQTARHPDVTALARELEQAAHAPRVGALASAPTLLAPAPIPPTLAVSAPTVGAAPTASGSPTATVSPTESAPPLPTRSLGPLVVVLGGVLGIVAALAVAGIWQGLSGAPTPAPADAAAPEGADASGPFDAGADAGRGDAGRSELPTGLAPPETSEPTPLPPRPHVAPRTREDAGPRRVEPRAGHLTPGEF
jgi:serine/threonine-protein kinase